MEFEIIDLNDKYLKEIFEEYYKILDNCWVKFPVREPWRFYENTNTGFIHAACAKLDYVAFREYPTKQIKDDKIHNARGDLFIYINDSNIFRVEAKQVSFFEIQKKSQIRQVQHRINENIKQIKRYSQAKIEKFENVKYISLIYVVPIIISNKIKGESELLNHWDQVIQTIKDKFYGENSFIVSTRNTYNNIVFKDEKGKSTGYPGIIVFGDILTI